MPRSPLRLCLVVLPALTLLPPAVSPAADVEQLVGQLDSDDYEARVAAAERLARLGADADPAIGRLAELVTQDDDADVRAAACYALGELQRKPDQALPALIAGCGDPSRTSNFEEVYQYAGEALRKFDRQPLPLMKSWLTGDDEGRKLRAARAVDQLEPALATELLPHLEPLLDSSNRSMRIAGINGMLKIGEPAKHTVPKLIELLEDEDFHTRYWSCRALAAMGEHSLPAVDKLIELLENDVSSVSRHAAAALGDIGTKGGEKVVEALAGSLQPGNFFKQEQAVIALGKLVPVSKSAQGDIERLLEDPRFRVRSQAAKTLWRMDPGNATSPAVLLKELKQSRQPQETVPVLGELAEEMEIVPQVAEALNSDNGFARQCAAAILGQLGPAAKPYLGALQKLAASDPDFEVRAAAQEAVELIRSK